MKMEMKNLMMLALMGGLVAVTVACGSKKKSEDIIAPRVEKVKPKAPIRMQGYTDDRDVDWIGKKYHVKITREASDSLAMVKDETGQKFVDNVFTLTVSRMDGSVFFSRTFTKSSMSDYLDNDFRKTGIFEGLVFDKADGDWLVFGASVGHPQTDEYIPLVIRLSRMGVLEIKRDVQMDTTPETDEAKNQKEQSSEEI